MFALPYYPAACIGVNPYLSTVLVSAPILKSNLTISSSPCLIEYIKGDYPSVPFIFNKIGYYFNNFFTFSSLFYCIKLNRSSL